MGVVRRAVIAAGMLAISGGLWAQKPPTGVKAKFTEKGRYESLTVSTGSGSESQSIAASEWRLELELPAEGFDMNALTAASPVRVTAGDAELVGTPGEDPNYRLGAMRVRLAKRGTPPRSERTTDLTVLELRHDRDRLLVKLEGKNGSATPLTGRITMRGKASAEEGALPVRVEIGELNPFVRAFSLPYRGRSRRQTREAGNAYGEVVTLDIKATGEVREAEEASKDTKTPTGK